jgi:DnaJ-class molecular chaperone
MKELNYNSNNIREVVSKEHPEVLQIVNFQIFESMFGGRASSKQRSQHVKFRGQDYNEELHLNLKNVYKTHKQTLTINGKNIRLSILAGVKISSNP